MYAVGAVLEPSLAFQLVVRCHLSTCRSMPACAGRTDAFYSSRLRRTLDRGPPRTHADDRASYQPRSVRRNPRRSGGRPASDATRIEDRFLVAPEGSRRGRRHHRRDSLPFHSAPSRYGNGCEPFRSRCSVSRCLQGLSYGSRAKGTSPAATPSDIAIRGRAIRALRD